MSDRPRAAPPLLIERVALAAVIGAVIACSLIRIDVTDTPWHLATARLALETGAWPTVNTFSYTHPDHPLYQQYPLYDLLLYGVWRVARFPGLSLLHCLVWLVVFALWIRWAGGWRAACTISLVWGLALLGLQRRMIVSPDMLTMFWLVCQLLLFDSYRRGRLSACIGLVGVQWLMANTHQLFPLGLAAQATFLIHLGLVRLGRWGLSDEDVALPVWPIALTLLCSAGACLATPLGSSILQVSARTASSLFSHRAHVSEFALLTSSPYALGLACVTGALALVGFWRGRHRWQPFELGLWLLGLALATAAIRGVAYFAVISVGLFARQLGRGAPFESRRVVRRVGAVLCLILCLGLIKDLWILPRPGLLGLEAGLGKKPGSWPDRATAFLRKYPPPGRLLNLGWYSGNALIWELYPRHPVYVDPRFESYPRAFLLEAIEATKDDATLSRLIERHQPDWIVAEVMLPDVRRRVAGLLRSRQWVLVYADTIWLVLVRQTPETRAYRAAHAFAPEAIEPTDWLTERPALLGLQQLRLAWLFLELGQARRAEEMVARATRLAADHREVAGELVQFLDGRSALRIARGDLSGALADCDAMLALDPQYAGARFNRGKVYFEQRQYEQAHAELDQAIRLAPDQASAYHARGLVRLALGRSTEAIADFGEAIRLDPRHVMAHAKRAEARDEAGDDLGAEADCRKALALRPGLWEIRVRLGVLLARRQQRTGALAAFAAAQRSAPPLGRMRIQRLIDELERQR